MCDVAHVLWLERVEDRDALDEYLSASPVAAKPIDPEQADLLDAFGLRRPA